MLTGKTVVEKKNRVVVDSFSGAENSVLSELRDLPLYLKACLMAT